MRTGWALKHNTFDTYIGTDGFFAFYVKDRNAAYLFETEEAARKWNRHDDYIPVFMTIKKRRRIPSFVQPKVK
jgi:hypothetical protein